jgi:predicted nucleic acid-binding protein
MNILIDTSAFFAILDRDDANHQKAKISWRRILEQDCVMITTNYIIVECFALVQSRLGMEAVMAFQDDIVPLLNMEFVDSATHKAGVSAMLAASRRRLSLVDCVSFEVARNLGIKNIFAFDPHFAEQGFLPI